MAIKTPFHRQRFLLFNDFHLIDAAVARNTADATRDVGSVVEVDKVRQIVDAFPFDRTIVVLQANANGFQQCAVGVNNAQIATGLP